MGLAWAPQGKGRVMEQADVASPELVTLDAVALSDAIRTRRVSCVEVMRATLDHVAALNPHVNAIVALQPEDGLLAQARARDQQLARGDWLGPLHGIPQAIKDLEPVAGIVSTQGSPVFKDFVPTTDSIVVERTRAAGAILIGRTNVPEFGFGSHTYNPVYGTTLNAYDQAKTAGGSSGGAAVAVALRMLAVADGSDFMGSLRNPAAYNNVFGLRPSYGRVPSGRDAFLPTMSCNGPIARTVPDLAMLLSVQAGHDPRVPLSIREDPALFTRALDRDFTGVRVAWGGDLRGHLRFEPGVLDLCEGALKAFERIGCVVEAAVPDYAMSDVWEDFTVLRSWQTGTALAPIYDDPAKRAAMKPEAIWEVERGLALSARAVARASAGRSAWYAAFRALLEDYDYFVLPSAQVFPFDAGIHWPKAIAGRPMDTYHRWMEVVAPVTMTGCPALNVPVGFNERGLPMGLQIVGPNHGEWACLQLAHAYDQATGWTRTRQPALMGRAAPPRAEPR